MKFQDFGRICQKAGATQEVDQHTQHVKMFQWTKAWSFPGTRTRKLCLCI